MDLIERYLMLKDTDLAAAIRCEEKRQQEQLELVASENYTSQAVMAVQGSVLTNKYAEGYPSKRYYGGCECVDLAEELAIRRAEELLELNMPMCSPIQEHWPIWLSIMRH